MTTNLKLLFAIILTVSIFSCKPTQKAEDKIDRHAVVTRHNVTVESFDTLSSLSVGNGKFAFTVDATGLQTFPSYYSNGVPLGIESEWGWHSFPNTENYTRDEAYKMYEVEGREIPYKVQWREPGRKQDASNYFRVNPHRLQLANFGFELEKPDGTPVKMEEITQINQELNLWDGLIKSNFLIADQPVSVATCSDSEKDLIAVNVQSDAIKSGLIGFNLRFPYPTGEFGGDASDWNKVDLHTSTIVENNANSATVKHVLDTTTYYVHLTWTGDATLQEKEKHYFVLQPKGESADFSVTAEFNPENDFVEESAFTEVKDASADQWKEFWQSGGTVDFSGTADPRAAEIERRVVLSQYLTRLQCIGQYPPQETGLTYNSWYGKPHLEMHWWHGVHFAYWNRIDLLEQTLDFYAKIYPKAKEKAETQGYKGVRWPKMTDYNGEDSPSGVGEFLIWQQPHIIYFAELCYQAHPTKETLEKYAKIIEGTADFMADFARYDEENDRWYLGPPLIPAQESLKREVTVNPPFEVGYFHWGLSIAQKWRERMGKEANPEWQAVIDGLPPFAQKDGLYLAAESAPDSYTNEEHFSDHPMVLGAFGILPRTVELDTATMARTFDYIEHHWNWDRTWGWDYPMAAMSATRLGKPEQAVDLLLKDVLKNTYLNNGHNYQGTRLRLYLPGNGGVLTAVAMMCAGFEGNKVQNPGFPKDWNVKWEGLKPIF